MKYGSQIKAAAVKNGEDPLLLAAIAAQESGGPGVDNGNANLLGDFGHGHGLTQIDDRWHSTWIDKNDWRDPGVNADEGASILAGFIRAENGDVWAGVHDYNAGNKHNASTKTSWPDGRLNYQDSVRRHLALLKKHHASVDCTAGGGSTGS
ncbi:MAG: transglycosylase SLT domain-containing protein [Vulcanimicrobiaceae bacterium]